MTILGWMVYAVAVGLLLSAAAWLLDRGLVRVALPVRWVWLGAIWSPGWTRTISVYLIGLRDR